MAEDLRLYSDFFQHPKTQMLRRRLGSEGVLALLQLWTAAANNYPDGDLAGKTDEFLEMAAGWTLEPTALTKSLRELAFLDGEEGDSRLHNWAERQPYTSKRPERQEHGKKAADARWKKAQNNQKRSERLAMAQKRGCHTDAEWEALLQACGSACVRCGREGTAAMERDHIVPLFHDESSDAIDNLQPLCKSCNSARGPETVDYRPSNWKQRMVRMLTDARSIAHFETGNTPSPPATPSPPTKSKAKEEKLVCTPPAPATAEDWDELHKTIAKVAALGRAKAMA